MRPEGNPLDLNNLPEDYASREGNKLASEDNSSSSAGEYRKKKSGAKEGKDEPAKVYECRFCSLKFCKSQALGGHMNRHRQERETETLNKARQLVFTNDLAPTGHLGYVSTGQPMAHGGGHHQAAADPYRPVYTTRMFPPAPPPPQPRAAAYMYGTQPRMLSFNAQYPASAAAPPVSDYFVSHLRGYGEEGGNYTCIGAPVGHGGGSVRNESVRNQGDGQSGAGGR